MVIISLMMHETKTEDGKEIFLLLVTYYNYESGEGVVVPMVFDAPEDMEDSFDMLTKIAKLQGGDEVDLSSPFSEN